MKQTQVSFTRRSTPLGATDVMTMATLLVGKHGKHAIGVADFMVQEHTAYKDFARAQAWIAVTSVANDMLAGRMSQHRFLIH